MADTDEHPPLHIDRNDEVQDTFHQKLYDLQKSSTLTDFTLKAGAHSIPCHKVVLMASSPYFEAMMSSEMSETLTNEATLKNINFDILDALVQYFYLGRVVVPLEYADVKGLVEAAEFLQLEKLKEECQDYLIRELNSNNCLGWCKVGMMFRLEKLVEESKRIMLENFNSVRESDEFLELTLAEVVDYISDDNLDVLRVDSLLEACKGWVMGDIETRRKHFKDLVKHLKIHDASSELITHFIKQNRDIIDQEVEMGIYQTVFAAKECNISKGNQQNCLILLGGFTGSCITNGNTKVKICKVEEYSWKDLPVIPTRGNNYRGFSVCQMQDGLLVTGGFDGQGCSREASLYITKYNAWSKVSSMSKARCYHGSISVENNAIIFGGKDKTGHTCDVEAFNGTHQKWIPAMPMLCETGGSPIYCNSQSHVFVIMNTYDGNDATKDDNGIAMQKYDMVRDKWTLECYIPKTITKTTGCAAVWFGDAVYIVGGFEKVCTRYSPATKTWLNLKSPPQIIMYPASIVLDKKILLLGGASDGQLKHLTTDVCEYDIDKDEWTKLQKKCPLGVCMAFAFCVQKHQGFLDTL